MDTTQIKQENEVVETQHQLMTLVDEAQTAASAVVGEVANDYGTTAKEDRSHGLLDFLKREVKLYQGVINSSDARLTQLARFTFPQDLINHVMYAPKIDGFRFLKGRIELRVVMNAQPFQAGIFRLVYFPVLSPDERYNTALHTMKQITGLNGVDVNLESREPMVINVPFIYPNPAYDLLLEPDPYANVALFVYSPLTDGTVNYTVFARFSEVELTMPISQVLPASRRYIKKMYQQGPDDHQELRRKLISLNKTRFWAGVLQYLLLAVLAIVTVVRDRLKKPMVVKQQGPEEDRARPGGLVSGIANAVSGIATSLSGIPFIGQFASTVAGVSGLVGNVASAFGWSKPRTDQVPTHIRPRVLNYFQNYSGSDSSQMMALDASNQVDVTNGKFGTVYDEMNFGYSIRVPQYITSFTVSETDVVDSRVLMVRLNPATLTTTLDSTSSFITTTNLGYVCSMFELWKGGLVFNIKVAKTVFHSMRLALVYFNTETEPPMTYSDEFAKNYQIIWDLRETFEQTVALPYIQPVEYLNIHSVDSQFKDHSGFFAVYIINSLVVGGQASSSIEFLVEVSAAEDFQVAIPKNPELLGRYVKPITSGPSVTMGIMRFMIDSWGPGPAVNRFYLPWRATWEVSSSGSSNIPIGVNGLKYEGVEVTTLMSTRIDNVVNLYNGSTLMWSQEIYENNTYYYMPGYFTWDSILTIAAQKTAEETIKNEITKTIEIKEELDETEDETLKWNPNTKFASLDNFGLVGTPLKARVKMAQAIRDLDLTTLPAVKRFKLERQFRFDIPGFAKTQTEEIVVQLKREGELYVLTIFDKYDASGRKIIVRRNYVVDNEKFVLAVEQNIGREESVLRSDFKKITGRSDSGDSTNVYTVGENIVSYRQLAKRYSKYRTINVVTANTYGYVLFDPHDFTGESGDVVDYPTMIAPLFRFYCGEMNYKFHIVHNNGTLYHGPIEVIYLSNYDKTIPPGANKLISSQYIHYQTIEMMGEFTIPFYNRNDKTILGDTGNVGLLSPIPSRVLLRVNTTATDLSVVIYRTIGENFTFGTLLSAPTLISVVRN